MRCFQNNVFYFAPIEQWLVDFVARYLVILNSSINFIIYCLVGSDFRKAFLQMFGFGVPIVSSADTEQEENNNNV